MSTLKELAQQIKTEKDNKIIPGKIEEDWEVFDVTGTLKSGTDTSDATATGNDLLLGKTAYSKGLKIVGTIDDSKLAKVFTTRTEMNGDTDKKKDKLAIVYGVNISDIEPNEAFTKLYLAENITFPDEVTTTFFISLNTKSAGGGGGNPFPVSSTGFNINIYSGMESAYIVYKSEDGIHYTRDGVYVESYEGGNPTLVWDESNSILSYNSDYEWFEYSVDNAYLDNAKEIFKSPTITYDGIFKCESAPNTNNVKMIKDLQLNTPDLTDMSTWSLDYTEEDKSYSTITTILNLLKTYTGETRNYYLMEKIDDNNYHCFVYTYTRTSSGSSYSYYGIPNFISLKYFDNLDTKTYIGFVTDAGGSSYSYSNYNMYAFNVNVSTSTVTNITSQYTLNSKTINYNSSTIYLKYMDAIDPSHYFVYGKTTNTSSESNNLVYRAYKDANTSPVALKYIPITCGYDLTYQAAETQFTLNNSNQLLNGYTALGIDGSYTGDGSIYNNLDTDTLLSGFFNMDLPTTYDNYLIGDPGNKVRYYKKSASGTKFLIKSKFSKFRELINTYASDSKGSFEYLSMDETMYFYLDKNKNLKIVDLDTEQTTTITLAQPSWHAGENLRFAKDIESILYIKSSDNKLYIYDVKAKQEYSTTITMSSLYDFKLVYADSNYIMVQSSNSSNNADKPTYVLDTSTRAIIWNANTGTAYLTWSTPSGNWYYQTQNATTLYKWNGSAFQSIRTSNLLVGLHSSTLALEDNNYLYIPCGDLNKIIKYAKSGSESYSKIDIVNNTSVSSLSLNALFIDGDYVWVTNSRYDNNFYFIKCTATINSGVPTFTEVEKIELPVLMYNKYGDNEYKLSCGYSTDRSLSLYNTLVKTAGGFDHYQNATSTSNTVSPMKIGNCNLIRVNESTSSDYDYKCIPKDKRTTYNSNNYDFPLYMLGYEDVGTISPSDYENAEEQISNLFGEGVEE